MLRRTLALATALSTLWASSAYAFTPSPFVQTAGGFAQPVQPTRPTGPVWWLPNVVNINGSTPDWKNALKQALVTPNTTVYLASTVDMDLSHEDSIPIAQGVALIGGQPCPLASQSVATGSPAAPGPAPPMTSLAVGPSVATHICGGRTATYPGPRLYTTTRPNPLFEINCIPGDLGGDGVRMSGFRVQGPDWDQGVGGDDHLEWGIKDESCTGVEISNMELSGWSGAAVKVVDPAHRLFRPEDVKVHDNFIHHNQHTGREGYGVDVSSGGYALIERNVFDFNRHAVTHGMIDPQDGHEYAGGYTANYNLVLKGGGYNGNPLQPNVQQFDVHGDKNCPLGSGFWNCGRSGWRYEIHNNAFQFTKANSFLLRGSPWEGAFVDNNVFARNNVGDAVGTAGWGTTNLFIGPNTSNLDSFGKYGVCDFDGDGNDDLFLATGTSWWYMSSAKQQWVYLNSFTDTIDQLAFGDFEGTGRCDVFAVHGDEWLLSSGGSSPWRSLGHFGVPFDQLRFGHFTGSNRTEIFRRAPDGSWWLISPGVFGWTQLAGSSLPLSQLHFGSFSGKGTTDVVANVNGHWSVSWGGLTFWQPLNTNLSDSLDKVLIADLDGKGTDDIIRYTASSLANGQWQVSVGGRTAWQPLAQMYLVDRAGGAFVGHFDGSKGAQILAIRESEDVFFPASCDPENCRRSTIYSRVSGSFTPYGKYGY